MKMLALALLLLAAPAFAGSITISTSAAQDARIAKQIAKLNKATCIKYGLPEGCTQGAARDAFCVRNGVGPSAPCNAYGVSSATVEIYSDASDFFDRNALRAVIKSWAEAQDADDNKSFSDLLSVASQAQKDAACQAIGLPAGCLP